MPLIYRTPESAGRTRPSRALAIAWLAITLGFGWLLRGTAGPHVELGIDMWSSQKDMAQVFYDRGHGYSESESITKSVATGDNHIQYILPSGPIYRLRFDPVNSAAAASVSRILMRSAANQPWRAVPLAAWLPTSGTKVDRNAVGTIALVPGATADPQLEFAPAAPLVEASGVGDAIERWVTAALLGLGLTTLIYKFNAIPERAIDKAIPMAMSAAGGLILALAMTSTTKHSVHPDEFSHLEAYQYYENHWLPPAVDSPATIPSTSGWGYSYLSELDVVYDIAAHATVVLTAITQDELRSARLFQVGLWALLCVMAMCRRRWAWVLSVVLLSPQIWYVFSYFNADAFPLFLSLIAAGCVADEESGLHRYLRTGEKRSSSMWIAAVCIGLLLVSKQNYLPLVPVYLLWLAVVHLGLRARIVAPILAGFLLLGTSTFIGDVPFLSQWHVPLALIGLLCCAGASGIGFWRNWKDRQTRIVLVRLIAFAMICIGVALPRLAWDVHVNGWPDQKVASVRAVAEARAGQGFKPSVIAQGKGDPTVGLAARGLPVSNVIFAPYNWGFASIASAFGVYGYMNIFAPSWCYWLLPGTASLIFLFAMHGARKTHPRHWRVMATLVVGGALLVAVSSLLFSWVDALQAQGRYLFPIFPMLALMIGSAKTGLQKRAFTLAIAVAVALSVYSFAVVALPAFTSAG